MTMNMAVNYYSGADIAIIRILEEFQSRQAIVVVWKKEFHADLALYQYSQGYWKLARRFPANVGLNGMGKVQEGDQKSPSGIFSLTTAFGNAPPPRGVKYPYRRLTPQDYWVDDNQSIYYNQWVRIEDGGRKDWNSAEWLWKEKTCYKYGVVIDYNPARQPGKGSAIFLHVWASANSPTQGCTAVSEVNMVRILKWLDPDKKPLIIQGTYQDVVLKAKIINGS